MRNASKLRVSKTEAIVYLDAIVVKIRQNSRVINKAIYLALGVNLLGNKELLGMWITENESSKFWLSVLTDLQQRGVKDIFIACIVTSDETPKPNANQWNCRFCPLAGNYCSIKRCD